MRSHLVPLHLPKSEYDELVRRAKEEERDPLQQARYLLRRALNGAPEASPIPPMHAMTDPTESGVQNG